MKKYTIGLLLVFLFSTGIITQVYSQIPAPINLKASVNVPEMGKGVKLSWEYPAKILVKFAIYRKDGLITDPGTFQKIEKSSLFPYYLDKNVTSGKKYTYYVAAVGPDEKESDPSNKADIVVTFTEPAKGTITGLLLSDATNKPVQRGKIQFLPSSPTAVSYLIGAVSDSLGRFSAKLIPGAYYVYAAAEKHNGEFYDNAKSRESAKLVNVTENGAVELTMSLAPYTPPVVYYIKGSVKNGDAKPLRAKVQVFRLNTFGAQKEACNLISGATDYSGNYSIPVRSNDTVVVFASPESGEYLPQYYKNKKTLQEADKLVITGNLADINFTPEKRPILNNSISGQVKDSASVGVTGSVVALRISDSKYRDVKTSVLTDSLGKYFIGNLIPGKYLLQVIPKPGYMPVFYRYDGKLVYDRRFADTISVTETSVLNNMDFLVKKIVKVKGLGIISGFIKDPNGKGINGAMSYILDGKGEFASYAISDGNGQYYAEGLTSGSYCVTAEMFEYKESSKEFVDLNTDSGINPVINFTIQPQSVTSVNGNVSAAVPMEYSLKQNYPNPFNPTTTIGYSIPKNGNVTLKVYNILGKEIATLVNEEKSAGNYSVKFNAKDIPSGLYLYTLTAGSYTETKKLVVLK